MVFIVYQTFDKLIDSITNLNFEFSVIVVLVLFIFLGVSLIITLIRPNKRVLGDEKYLYLKYTFKTVKLELSEIIEVESKNFNFHLRKVSFGYITIRTRNKSYKISVIENCKESRNNITHFIFEKSKESKFSV